MITLHNTRKGIEYHIRLVPMEEAFALLKRGQVFYDYTKLTAINTCPTWGVLRYGMHRTDIPLTASGRMLAVECGTACHDFFAAIRLWSLLDRFAFQEPNEKLFQQTKQYGIKLFGKDRWESMGSVPQDSDRINNAQLFALDALHTSGYYDDPSDRKRTLANMETSCLAYADRYFSGDSPVLVRDGLIGIEIPFVLEVTRNHINSTQTSVQYYCGRIDGVHEYGDGAMVAENKTAASLSSSWRNSFAISPQVTGYTIAGTCLLGQEVTDAQVMGVQIPLPRNGNDGVVFQPESRTESDRLRWAEWFFESIATYERYMADPTDAPRYAHSCNRYFSSCQFIPYCALTREEQEDALASMRVDEWSPLDHLDKPAVE